MKRKTWLVPALALAMTTAMILPAAATVWEEGTALPQKAVSEVQKYEKSAFLSVDAVAVDGVTYSIGNGYASVVGYTGDISHHRGIAITCGVGHAVNSNSIN